jgi:ABC-type polysaccharide/polyol phosphate export permease
MGFFLVMKAEIVRSWIIMRRYWFRTLTGIIVGYGMLMILIVGFMSKGCQPQDTPPASRQETVAASDNGAAGEDNTQALPPGSDITSSLVSDPSKATEYVLGFIIGLFAFGIVGLFTQGLQEMARTGVLEQLCLSPHGLVTNFLARSVVGGVNSIVSSAIMLMLVAWSLQGALYWDPVTVPLLLVLTFTNLLGFGFMVGGLVLVFKQTGQVAIIMRLVLMGLALFATEEMLQGSRAMALFLHILPVTDAAICLKYVLIQGQHLAATGEFVSVYQHPSHAFWWLLVNCVLWTGIGIVCFKVMENYSRHKGTLGAY